MNNIAQTINELNEFFSNGYSMKEVMNTLRSKYEEFMMKTYNVPDWKCDEKWLYHLASGISNRPTKQITIGWIYKQFAEQAKIEIMEN